ncbi:MAG: hypothetical protein Q9213_008258, partial [Squamulea squamosa]
MGTEFIGSIVTVTLNEPHDGQVCGLVEAIAEGQRLDLKNVTWLAYGTQVASLSIETSNISDLNIEPDARTLPPLQEPPQRSPDPAILTFERSAAETDSKIPIKLAQHDATPHNIATAEGYKTWGRSCCPVCQSQFVGTLQDRTSNIKRHLRFVHGQQGNLSNHAEKPQELTDAVNASANKPASPAGPDATVIAGATATLSGPFTELTLDDPTVNGLSPDQEPVVAAKAPSKKKPRHRRSVKKNQKDEPDVPSERHAGSAQTPTRAAGWGEPPFLQEASTGKKPQPLDAPIQRAEQKQARAKKGRHSDLREEQNGWATEEATDIQDLGEFDFEGNLSKFDKRGVFEQIRQDDTTADEARLVSFNRLPARPGTNGGKNLHYSENVLGSPRQNGHMNSSGESEISNDQISSGRVSRRNVSRASIRKPPSRKSSTMIPPDQTPSSGIPHRYSSQEYPSPRAVGKGYPGQYPRTESLRSSKPSFRLIASGAECPSVTPLQMLELEQLAMFELGLSDDMINENAARSIAQLALKITTGKRIIILAGNTKTGARAIAAARQLRNHGMRVLVFVLGIEREEDILDIVRRQLNIYYYSGGQLLKLEKLLMMGREGKNTPADLIVDALLGMHLSFEDLGAADQSAFYEIASWANSTEKSVLAMDVPSGVDAASGVTSRLSKAVACSIVPDYILALGAPKTGLLPLFAEAVNEGERLPKVFVADTGISNSVWKKFGTRRRYGITHSEWASEDAYSASAGSGSGASKSNASNAPFKRLPFNFCAISLQPFDHPVCSPEGTIFDITNILPWLKKHGTNPVTGAPLKSTDLIKLNFTKNDDGEMVDPVTFKVFTNNTHIVALKNTSNVFAYDTIERLNIKAKNWRDLVSEEDFSRKDIITLQDPQNVESRNLSSFKYLQEDASTLTPEQQRERNDPSRNVNTTALGNGASLFKPSRKEQLPDINPDALANNRASIAKTLSALSSSKPTTSPLTTAITAPTNTTTSTQPRALHTTGLAAASLTSTGLTPHTTADLASLSLESYLLVPRRVRTKGYCLLTLHPLSPTSPNRHQITLELAPEFAPKACWNFIQLAKKGYYNNLLFHRNIPGFMIQGGDPTGSGKGGASCWNKNFDDELDGPLSMKFDKRGMLAMANKGKNTNGSQFFITYRGTPHLVRKHTVFGQIVEDESFKTLKALEGVEVDDKSRPKIDVRIKE